MHKTTARVATRALCITYKVYPLDGDGLSLSLSSNKTREFKHRDKGPETYIQKRLHLNGWTAES